MSKYLLIVVTAAFLLGANEVPIPLSNYCLARSTPNYDEVENLKLQEHLSPKVLIEHRFGLWSFVYPVLPRDGYPIVFKADGTTDAQQFGGAKWSVNNNELQLRAPDDSVVKTFKYHHDCKSLTFTVHLGDVPVLMEIAILKDSP